jgi:hypothetical protein
LFIDYKHQWTGFVKPASLEKKGRLLYILNLTKREADEILPFEDVSLEVKKERKDG